MPVEQWMRERDARRARRPKPSPTADGRYREHLEYAVAYDRGGAYERADPCWCRRGVDHGERLHG